MARKEWTIEELAEQPSAKRLAKMARLLDALVLLACSFSPGTEAGFDYLVSEIRDRRRAALVARPQRPARKPTQKEQIPPALSRLVMERDAYRCRHCGTWHDLTIDHIYPESLGGALDPDNLQTLCAPCNSRKGARS